MERVTYKAGQMWKHKPHLPVHHVGVNGRVEVDGRVMVEIECVGGTEHVPEDVFLRDYELLWKPDEPPPTIFERILGDDIGST